MTEAAEERQAGPPAEQPEPGQDAENEPEELDFADGVRLPALTSLSLSPEAAAMGVGGTWDGQ